jgi:hypothetical protein
MSINKSVPIVCFAFAILTVLPNVAQAQLIDLNNRCFYQPGSTFASRCLRPRLCNNHQGRW